MARSKRLLILVAVLLAVCAAAFAALNWQQRQEQIAVSGQEVLTIDPDSVRSLAWTYGETSLAFTRDGEGNWSYDEDEAFPVDPEAMEELLAPFAPFSAAFVIEEVEDEGQYGLDDPACSITLVTEDQTWEIRLGDTSTVDGQRYVSFGAGTVYLAASDPLEQYDATLRSCILNDAVPDWDQVTGLTFSGAEDYEIFWQEDGSAWSYCADDVYFTERGGNTLPLDTGRVEDYLSDLATLGLTNYVTYNATQEELEQYGLDDPELTVAVDYTGTDADGAETSGTFTLHLSRDPEELAQAEEDAGDEEETITAYVRVGDSPIVYAITSLEYTDLRAAAYDDLRHREVLTASFDDVLSLDVTLEGETYTFTAQGEGDERTWTWEGREIDFADLQDAVEALAASEFTDERPAGQQEISLVVYLDNETFPQVEVTLYRYDGALCLAEVDGASICLVDRSDVVNLMEAVRAVVLADYEEDAA